MGLQRATNTFTFQWLVTVEWDSITNQPGWKEEAENSQARNPANLLTTEFTAKFPLYSKVTGVCMDKKSKNRSKMFSSRLTLNKEKYHWIWKLTFCDLNRLAAPQPGQFLRFVCKTGHSKGEDTAIPMLFGETLPLSPWALGALVNLQRSEAWAYFCTNLAMSWSLFFLSQTDFHLSITGPPMLLVYVKHRWSLLFGERKKKKKRIVDSGSLWRNESKG